MPSDIRQKIRRIQDGEPPRVLDLFSGCGGISLGLLAAGYEVVGAVEADRDALAAYLKNISISNRWDLAQDIRALDAERLVARGGEEVDVLVGGPPCQAYSRVGRAKLRQVKDDPIAWQVDERASLYEHYLRIVVLLRPVALLIENVPDILTHGSGKIPSQIVSELTALGYRVRYTLLNAVHYGVPQFRERFFLLGLHDELGRAPVFPRPTRTWDLPTGYRDVRAMIGHAQPSLFGGQAANVKPPLPNRSVDRLAVTVGDAIDDLPRIEGHLSGKLSPGMKAQDRPLPYRGVAGNRYAQLMRTWPGRESPDTVQAHVIRLLPRDYEIFARMAPGDQYPKALEIAEEIFEQRLAERRAAGDPVPPGSAEWHAIRRATVPPYDDSKFPGKWQKLDATAPAHTLTAHLSRDCYSHIHHDSSQARTISVREAARLQSFPDGFHFPGGMNSAYSQIGNAVPPLLSCALGQSLLRSFRGTDYPEQIDDPVDWLRPPEPQRRVS